MSLAWVLKDPRITSVIIGASKARQVLNSVECLQQLHFSVDHLRKIDEILLKPFTEAEQS
jgi:L-glyceraldehyde 3-phosphate reductase